MIVSRLAMWSKCCPLPGLRIPDLRKKLSTLIRKLNPAAVTTNNKHLTIRQHNTVLHCTGKGHWFCRRYHWRGAIYINGHCRVQSRLATTGNEHFTYVIHHSSVIESMRVICFSRSMRCKGSTVGVEIQTEQLTGWPGVK